MGKIHNCPLCSEEAVPERCANYQFDWELEEEYVDQEMTTIRIGKRIEIGLQDYLKLVERRIK